MAYRFLETFQKRLVGGTDIKDAPQRLDKLIQDEARRATAEGLKTAHSIDTKLEDVSDEVKLMYVHTTYFGRVTNMV